MAFPQSRRYCQVASNSETQRESDTRLMAKGSLAIRIGGRGVGFFHDKQKPVSGTKWPRLLCSGSSIAPEPAGATSPAAPPARSCEERHVCEPPRSSSWAQRPPPGGIPHLPRAALPQATAQPPHKSPAGAGTQQGSQSTCPAGGIRQVSLLFKASQLLFPVRKRELM